MKLTLTLLTMMLMMVVSSSSSSSSVASEPQPAPWPEQFHATLFMNNTKKSSLQITELWYDWPNGRNLNLIQKQLGKLLYDVEWTNGTSYYFTRDATKECITRHFEVGILRPNWLQGATYLGRRHVDGFLCNVWTKVDFIWYYEDVVSKRPVYWLFYTGLEAHVITFEVGNVLLLDSEWQAPAHCFHDHEKKQGSVAHDDDVDDTLGLGLLTLRSHPLAFV